MFRTNAFRRCLVGTTALLSALMAASSARAVTYNISSPVTTTQTLNFADNIIVTSSGSIIIPGTGDAVTVTGGAAAGSVTNSGVITGGTTSAGLNIPFASLSGALINNKGATISGDYYGVKYNGGNIVGGITNSGLISSKSFSGMLVFGNASGGITNDAGGTISGAQTGLEVVGSGAADLGFGIVNSGLISGGTSAGLRVQDIDFSGTITNKAGGTISGGASGFGVALDNSSFGGLANDGLITGIVGIYASSSCGGGAVSSITNNAGGVIEGTGGTAINVTSGGGGKCSGSAGDLVINGGQILGDVIGAAGKGDTLDVTVNGDFTTNGNFDVSSLKVTAGNTLTISVGNVITTGSMVPTAGSHTLQFEVRGKGAVGEIVVPGGAIVLTGATIAVHDTGKAKSASAGDIILIADGALPIVGGPGGKMTQVADDSSLVDFMMADGTQGGTDDTDLFLFVIAQAASLPTAGNQDVLTILQGQSGNPDPDVQNALANANGAPGSAALNAVLDSLQSETDPGVPDTVGGFARLALDTTDTHLDQLESGASSGNGGKGLSTWGRFFGQALNANPRGGQAGYNARTGGFTLGAESQTFLRNAVAGVSISYGRSTVDSGDANTTQTDIDSYQLSLYAHRDFGDAMYARGMAGYAYNTLDTARFNVGGGGGPTARGSFSASQFTAQAETGKRYSLGHATVTPFLLADWTHFDPQSYTETGAGGLNQTVNGAALDKVELGAGVKAKWGWTDKHGNKAMPGLHAGYRFDLVGDKVEATSAFTGGGGAFTSQGVSPARSSFNAGVSMVYETTSNWELQAGYDADLRQDFISHSGTIRGTYRY